MSDIAVGGRHTVAVARIWIPSTGEAQQDLPSERYQALWPPSLQTSGLTAGCKLRSTEMENSMYWFDLHLVGRASQAVL